MKTCKKCDKELIGKEKLFCKRCFSKGKDKVIKGGGTLLGLGLTVISVVFLKGRTKGD